jgi:hypothetical protein
MNFNFLLTQKTLHASSDPFKLHKKADPIIVWKLPSLETFTFHGSSKFARVPPRLDSFLLEFVEGQSDQLAQQLLSIGIQIKSSQKRIQFYLLNLSLHFQSKFFAVRGRSIKNL